MTPETLYESGWETCLRCGTRRPVIRLTDGACNDGWCEQFEAERREDALAQARARGPGHTLELPFEGEAEQPPAADAPTPPPEPPEPPDEE